MDKIKELKIDSTLWATPSKIVNLLDFKPGKLSIETKSNTNNDIKVHNVRYENGGFYLTIDNLRGYFNFSNNLGTLSMLFANNDQRDKYYRVWKGILKIINGGHGELKLHEKITLFNNELPIERVFNDVIQPLCVILPQMSGYIKYFDDGRKNMSFITDDKEVYKKYNEYGKK